MAAANARQRTFADFYFPALKKSGLELENF
jgi:hypothetical protein